MLTKVDERDGKVIFKVTNPKGKVLGYRTFPVTGIGDSSQCREYTTLGEARAVLPPIADTSPKTPPKGINPQNQPGYKAVNGKTKH